MTLAEFLKARIAEDEAVARAALSSYAADGQGRWHAVSNLLTVDRHRSDV